MAEKDPRKKAAITPAERSAARATRYYPVVGALLIPGVMGVCTPSSVSLLKTVFAAAAGVLLFCTLLHAYAQWYTSSGSPLALLKRRFLLLPPFTAVGTDLRETGTPWCTVFLIASNAAAFLFTPTSAVEALCFPPVGDPSAIHLVLSSLTSAFLHADFKHLFMNMAFLWTFGSAVEPRTGGRRFLLGYALAIATSQGLAYGLYSFRAEHWGAAALGEFHTVGSSGAVFGVMALFVVRCFFGRVSLGLPAALPIGSIRAEIPGILVVFFFVLYYAVGSMSQFGPFPSRINHWSHIGGYLGVFFLAYLMGLHREAREELLAVWASRLSRLSHRTSEANALYAEILQKNPENEKALQYFLDRYKRVNPEKAVPYYRRLVPVLMKKNVRKAVQCVEANPETLSLTLDGRFLLRLGMYHYRAFRLEQAERFLRQAAFEPGHWQAKALLSLAATLYEMGRDCEALKVYEQVADGDPGGPFHQVARARLKALRSEASVPSKTRRNPSGCQALQKVQR